MTNNTDFNTSKVWINSVSNQPNDAYYGDDVFVDVVIDSGGEAYTETEYIPTFKDAVEFLANEARARVGEYMTPFNILIMKVIAIAMAIVVSMVSIVVGTFNAHRSKEQKQLDAVSSLISSACVSVETTANKAVIDAVSSSCSDVLGKWYEFDPESDDIRTMTISVDDKANCVYTLGGINGYFEYRDGILKLKDENDKPAMTLNYEDENLLNESSGVRYYRTNANIDSLKFAEFLKKKLPGTYQDFLGEYLYIYPDGKWNTRNPWTDGESGKWTLEINEACVSMIFHGMGIHYGGGNIYKVTSNDYEAEKTEINGGDYAMRLDVSSYDRISGDLP